MIEKLKDKILCYKLLIINAVFFLICYFNSGIVQAAQYLYKDVEYLHQYLIISGFLSMIVKGLGNWFYDIVSYLLDGCYEAYDSLSQLNIIESTNIQSLLNNIDNLVYSVFFIIFIIAVICKILKIENPLKVLANTGVCFIAVILFSTVLSMGVTLKEATVKDIDSIINEGDQTISETIYAQNTVDVLKSLKQGRIVNLSAADMKAFDKDEVVRKAYLYDYSRIDENGQVVYENLDNGMWFTGWGEERYYRYNTDFWAVNTTVIASTVVFLLAIFKHGFLIVDWFIINVFGKFGLGRGIFAIENIGKVAKSISDNLVAQVILFAMMSLFSIYSSAVMTSDVHWLVKSLLIFSFGMTVFIGSDFINKGLGISDNFGKATAAIFAANRLGGMASRNTKKLFRAGKSSKDKINNAIGKDYDKMSEDYQNKFDNAMQSDDFKDAMDDGKDDFDVQQAKEKISEQSYNDDIQERAKREMYGDDYKVQEEKEKLMQGEEKSNNVEQAKKELYGDNYKVQEEKSKLIHGDEKEQAIQQAKEQVYGADYKYQEVKDDVIKGEERSQLKDKAKRELHGDDYKEKKMRADIEQSLDREEMKADIIKEREMSSDVASSSHKEPLQYEEVDPEDLISELPDLLKALKKGEL